MKNQIWGLMLFTILITACNKKGNETKISSFNSDESHNSGQNCMTCHKSGGDGEGWFNAAGTVYDSVQSTTFPNSTVQLFTEANGGGSLKYTIQVDAMGNFYTTEKIDFGNGLYPAVVGNNTTKYMSSKITNGACNSCHGVSTDRIWSK